MVGLLYIELNPGESRIFLLLPPSETNKGVVIIKVDSNRFEKWLVKKDKYTYHIILSGSSVLLSKQRSLNKKGMIRQSWRKGQEIYSGLVDFKVFLKTIFPVVKACVRIRRIWISEFIGALNLQTTNVAETPNYQFSSSATGLEIRKNVNKDIQGALLKLWDGLEKESNIKDSVFSVASPVWFDLITNVTAVNNWFFKYRKRLALYLFFIFAISGIFMYRLDRKSKAQMSVNQAIKVKALKQADEVRKIKNSVSFLKKFPISGPQYKTDQILDILNTVPEDVSINMVILNPSEWTNDEKSQGIPPKYVQTLEAEGEFENLATLMRWRNTVMGYSNVSSAELAEVRSKKNNRSFKLIVKFKQL